MKPTRVSRQAGFTLIELLVVLMIVGILASLSAPNYQRALIQAEAARAAESIHYLEEAVNFVLAEYGSAAFPSSQLIIGPSASGSMDATLRRTGLDRYLTESSFDLDWASLYIISNSGSVKVALVANTSGASNRNAFAQQVIPAVGRLYGPRWSAGLGSGQIQVATLP